MDGPPPGDATVALAEPVAELRAGRLVLIVDDDADRGHLVAAAASATTETLVYLSTYGHGPIGVTLSPERLEALGLPPLTAGPDRGEDFHMPVDVVGGERPLGHVGMAAAVRALADPASAPADFAFPGHVFPMRTAIRGLLDELRPQEAAADLADLAEAGRCAVLCVAGDEQGAIADAAATRRLATRLSVPVATVAEIARQRQYLEPSIVRAVGIDLPSLEGPMAVTAFVNSRSGDEYYVFWRGAPGAGPIDVHVHVRCQIGDVFGGNCVCGETLQEAVAMIHRDGRGMIVYVAGEDGDGLRHLLGGDSRPPNVVDLAHLLHELKVGAARVTCNEPLDVEELVRFGIEAVAGSSDPRLTRLAV